MAGGGGVGEPEFALANADFVTERLATGGDLALKFATAKAQLGELVQRGITHIADLRIEADDADLVALYAPSVTYLHHPEDDAGQRIPHAWFERLTAWAREALADPEAKVLVHCHMGINRGPSGAFAILLDQGWGVPAALGAIRRARPIAAIDYAGDALDWHLTKRGATLLERQAAFKALATWRKRNRLDVEAVIRLTRSNAKHQNAWLFRFDAERIERHRAVIADDPDVAVLVPVHAHVDDFARHDYVIVWERGADGAAGRVVGIGLLVGPPEPLPAELKDAAGEPDTLHVPVVHWTLGLALQVPEVAAAAGSDDAEPAVLTGEALDAVSAALARSRAGALD